MINQTIKNKNWDLYQANAADVGTFLWWSVDIIELLSRGMGGGAVEGRRLRLGLGQERRIRKDIIFIFDFVSLSYFLYSNTY